MFNHQHQQQNQTKWSLIPSITDLQCYAVTFLRNTVFFFLFINFFGEHVIHVLSWFTWVHMDEDSGEGLA